MKNHSLYFALRLFTSAFILLTSAFSFSQDVKFSRIGSEQGLSQASVNCILQDSKGFMWFGTQDGLNKYNGYGNDMIVYKHDPSDSNSLSNNFIESLYEDSKGTIWVGTKGGGLNAINTYLKRITRFVNDPRDSTSISSDQVKCIFEDRAGTFWVGTTFGLNSFNGKANEFKRYIHASEDTLSINGFKVECIHEDAKGRLWVGTLDGGLNLYDREKQTFSCFLDHSANGTGDQHFNTIKCITEDKTGILWIGTDNGGLVKFDPETKKFQQRFLFSPEDPECIVPENRISFLSFDGKGALWIGTENRGISCVGVQSGTLAMYRFNEYDSQSLSMDGINYIYKDGENNMWVGTEGGGISVYFPNAARFKHFHKDIANEDMFRSSTVFGLLQDKDGLIWVGTMHGGITTIDRVTNTYSNYGDGKDNSLSSARSNSVLSLFEDKDGLIYVGTWGGGLNTFDKTTKKITRLVEKGAITCIAQGYGDIIWIGTYGYRGLYGYSKTAKQLTPYSQKDGLSSDNIYCVYEDKDRRVWIGTAGEGLNMLDYKTQKVKVYKHQKTGNSISDNTVNCIYDDRKGNLWIGTSNGMNRFDVKTQTFTQYNEKDGLPNGNVWGILGDKRGNLWISTNRGLSRFNPKVDNVDGIAFKNFSVHDGLQGDEFAQGASFLNKQTGEMFFGGLNGFNAFYPDNVSDNKHIPPVYITSLKKFGKEAEMDSSVNDKKYIELSYKDNFISFEFVALDYIFPEKNKYSFTMDGLDNDWSPPSTRRYVSYTNLPGGDYVFRVRASNSDGVWNETGTAIHIKVIPPWWKTNTFYSLCVLLSISSVFGFIRYRTAKVERENKILENKVAERTAELAQKNKDITSSIQYAKRIQQAILPTREQIQKHFPDSFVLFKPKDIVSGDFYWFGEKNGRRIAACVDCTGHGVPGAFMSMIGTNLLNQIILEGGVTEPAAILTALNQGVRAALKQGTQTEIETSDGMDIALCSIEPGKREVQFSSALRHLVVVSDNKLEKIDGNKSHIGGTQQGIEEDFTNHIKFLKKGDMLYMFSDGYADQFGGEKGKKLMIKKLHETLIRVNTMGMAEQRGLLDRTFEDWRGNHSQVDDVLVIGIRI